MIPELGHFAQIIGLAMAIALTLIPAWGAWRGNRAAMQLGPGLASGMTVLVLLSFVCLSISFVQDDFSVALVANNSNTLLPMVYKLCAVFGNHEGSMLLWSLILCLWTLAVAVFSPSLPLIFQVRVLSVMGSVAVGFLSFSLFTSNPFARLLPGIPAEGSDLNPLLQDPGMIIHPPLLYIGYAGFSVAFAFAIAALLGGRLDAAWARWSRPWTNVAWAFLSLGIMLGSWWAYYELGWGGWWFWDPVENASFMPWLAGTALIHSLAVTEKRGLFKSWTVLLAIFAFSLSLLGTFLVRSGVITSVHAFANDPERGVFILVFLAIVVGGSLTLYALRAPAVASRVGFSWISRESLLLLNNVVFLVATLTVLFGTLFPLLMDALGGGKYSVGPPYFNAVFVPLMALLVPFMGIGPLSRWKKDTTSRWRQELLLPLSAAVICAVTLPLVHGEYNLWVALAVLLAGWLVFGLARDLWNRINTASDFKRGVRRLPASYWGMVVAHLGFAACIVGVVATSQYSIERDLKMKPGETEELAGYEFRFVEVAPVRGPNFVADEARFEVVRAGEFVANLAPQKRRYLAGGSIMTEAAIAPGLFRDLYVAMGEPIGNDGSWAVRLHYKPMVRWMWLGAILMAVGGFCTVADKRYRSQRRSVTAGVKGAEYAG
ncbi:heme lyase CcmF/NrfE family subunit [Halioglobus maricola]|uniref:Heme lyase CcmF/NrfE family subunit n=1 Tax=Halioglobus maricola TaxID=2601894 RepID=A0A5P9NKP5_9GAMM|nr:heme lyase CcmF/NrfE family subunit [Halioglobus maricola]QFU76085.1 heme lyase CcmF/NrfE family subunit [Halioglobus maricola]